MSVSTSLSTLTMPDARRTTEQRPCHPRWHVLFRPLCQDSPLRSGDGVSPDISHSSYHLTLLSLGDFTKINIANQDEGGELDPHGATGLGNPIGGNVTSNVSGSDVHYEEWMK